MGDGRRKGGCRQTTSGAELSRRLWLLSLHICLEIGGRDCRVATGPGDWASMRYPLCTPRDCRFFVLLPHHRLNIIGGLNINSMCTSKLEQKVSFQKFKTLLGLQRSETPMESATYPVK
jgi:hypothetical protein